MKDIRLILSDSGLGSVLKQDTFIDFSRLTLQQIPEFEAFLVFLECTVMGRNPNKKVIQR